MARREAGREGTRQSPANEPQNTRGGDITEREQPVQPTREGRAGTSMTRGGMYEPGSFQVAPFSIMRRLSEDFDRLFADFGMASGWLSPRGGRSDVSLFGPGRLTGEITTWSPQIDVFERGDKLVVRADLPGLRKEDLNVEIEDGALTIQGERKHEFEETREGVYTSERSYGRFYRAIPLPEGVTADDVQANFRDGVLEVKLPKPKRSTSRGRKIDIR